MRGLDLGDGSPALDRRRGSAFPSESPWPKGKARSMLRQSAMDIFEGPPSPPRPAPILVGEQVRGLPKVRRPTIPQPSDAGDDGLKQVRFSESLLTAPDMQHEFTCFLIIISVILGFVLGTVAYHYMRSDISSADIPPTPPSPDTLNESAVLLET
ncbi:uncharacterized protein LOC144129784 [Amblyomma americanum]